VEFLRALSPWIASAVRHTGFFTPDFLGLQKNLMFADYSDWDIVMSTGNTHPLHSWLWHMNLSHHVATCSTVHSYAFHPLTLIGSVVILVHLNSRSFFILPKYFNYAMINSFQILFYSLFTSHPTMWHHTVSDTGSIVKQTTERKLVSYFIRRKWKVFENEFWEDCFNLREVVTGRWRKLHNEDLCNLFISPNISD
jgi:hypothetical protein